MKTTGGECIQVINKYKGNSQKNASVESNGIFLNKLY